MYTGDRLVVDGGSFAEPAGRQAGDVGSSDLASTSATTIPAISELLVSDATRVAISHVTSISPDVPSSILFDVEQEPATQRETWHRRYAVMLVLIDVLAAFAAVVAATLIPFPLPSHEAALGPDRLLVGSFAVILPLAWIAAIALNRGYQSRIVGVGPAEFQRVFRAFCHLTAVVAFVAYASKANDARGIVLASLPLTMAFDLVGRYAARKRLHRHRAAGRKMMSVIAVGGAVSVAEFTAMLRRDRYAGMLVVGACLPTEQALDPDSAALLAEIGVPVLGDVDSVLTAVRRSGAHTVAAVSGEISAEKLRWISWQLEGTETDLVVSPGLVEVAGTRLHIQPVAGLPLLHVEEPEFTGFRRFLKAAFDRTVAAVIITFITPVLVGVALAVRLTSRGPALFRQTRVGLDGSTFTMIKFRSMYVDAESRLADLMEFNVNSDGLLFKVKDDPRITRVGRILRKYSLDELPQLFNVLTGEMSLVGPRPPLPAEVAKYGADVRRRLLVKPGMTGMWQISGRNDLAWDESVRLDLRYVENWSFALDLMILWKTIFAVVKGGGAY
jgi:exopolysaccharide biosynthesis polyprenyl glycosylphosphotransferase